MHIVIVAESSAHILPPYFRVLQAYSCRWPIITFQWVRDTLASETEVAEMSRYLISDPKKRVDALFAEYVFDTRDFEELCFPQHHLNLNRHKVDTLIRLCGGKIKEEGS